RPCVRRRGRDGPNGGLRGGRGHARAGRAAVIPFLFAALAAAPALAAPARAAPETVEGPAGDHTLKAVVFRPDGDGPFPAVVAVHGCSGLFDTNGAVRERYQDWGDHLAAAGFVVLYADSFTGRGLKSQCLARERRAV